jgi:hypothetical protein
VTEITSPNNQLFILELLVKSDFTQKTTACNKMIAGCCFSIETGGERGIRTLDTLLRVKHFPGVLLQPLGHLSFFCGLQK